MSTAKELKERVLHLASNIDLGSSDDWDALVEAVNALAPAETAHQAIDEALIVCELPPIGDGEPVRDALQRLISWHVGVALDPRVSSCAPAGVEEFPLPELPEPDGWACMDYYQRPAAIRNGKFATIAHVAAQGLGMVMGPSLAAPASAGVEEFPLPEPTEECAKNCGALGCDPGCVKARSHRSGT